MADTTTANLGLLIADLNDTFSFGAHVEANYTTIDGLMGAVDCISTGRPTNTYKGQIIYEHDTGRYAQNTGTKATPAWTYMSHQAYAAASSARPTLGLTAGELLYETDNGLVRPRGAAAWLSNLPTCTSSGRPANPVAGDMAVETDTGRVIWYTGSAWAQKAYSNFVCTSGTHPASPFQGLEIFETDTGLTGVYNGSGYLYGMQQLAPTQSVSAAASITFSGLPAVGRLMVLWRLRNSTTGSALGAQIDGDTTSGHYIWAKTTTRAAAVTGSASAADTSIQIGTVAGNSTANYFSAGLAVFNGWNSTNGFCNTASESSCWDSTSSYWQETQAGLFLGSAAAHTSLKLSPGSGTLTGEVTIYGGP